MNRMQRRATAAAMGVVLGLVVTAIFWHGLIGHNNDSNWQVYQSPTGSVTVIDGPGFYGKWFGSVWEYPRAMEARYENDQAVKVTFNDGGTAKVDSFVRIQMPTEGEQRRRLHRDFGGSAHNILASVRSHLTNCLKASGPVMSASQNQASRKAEFNQIVEEQLERGLFAMRSTQVELDDMAIVEDGGKEKKARVAATEIVHHEGKPVVIQTSPLKQYGITILQFSITDIEYDAQTLAQFASKKDSYLNAERSKAQRQEEVQQRLMVTEKGLRQVAEITAEENQVRARALIQAQQAADVAVIAKAQAVTDAQRKVEVAQQAKAESETLREIARIEAQTAELHKQSAVSLAEAKQKEIELGGGISDEKRVLATIAAERDAKVAAALAGVQVPGVVIGNGGGGNSDGSLMNLVLLKAMGVLPEAK
jgi:hypothetical protein